MTITQGEAPPESACPLPPLTMPGTRRTGIFFGLVAASAYLAILALLALLGFDLSGCLP